MTDDNRKANAEEELRAACEAFEEAKVLHKAGHWGGGISRAYYAAYHAARALLYQKGLEPKTHEGVRRMIALHFVLPGSLPQGIYDGLVRLALQREASDYAPATRPSAEDSSEALRLAQNFLNAAGIDVGS